MIRLQHEHAKKFFEDALQPDIEELKRRDSFLARLQQECPVYTDGTSLITEIPDIDIAALLGNSE